MKMDGIKVIVNKYQKENIIIMVNPRYYNLIKKSIESEVSND